MFDVDKLAWINRHYLKLAEPARLARLAIPYLRTAGWVTEPGPRDMEFLEAVIPLAAASVDRLEQVAPRLAFLFDYSPARALLNADTAAEAREARDVIEALAAELASAGPLLDREAFRSAAGRVRDRTGRKGKALFHPIRVALTGETEGLELDLAVPAIDRGAALGREGVVRIASAAERAAEFAAALRNR